MKKLKDYFWPSFIIFLLIIIGYVVFYFIQKNILKSFFDEINWTSKTSLAAIDPHHVKRLADLLPGDITGNEDFTLVNGQVVSLGALFAPKGIDAVYLLSKKDNNIYFLVESTSQGDPLYVTPGKLYEKPPIEVSRVFSNKVSSLTSKYTDEYGAYVSEFSPVVDEFGEEVAVLGVDVDYNYYQTKINQAIFIFATAWFFLSLFLILSFLYFRNLNGSKKKSIITEQKITAISNSVNDGIVVIDSDSKIVFWNKTCEIIFGLPFEKVIGLKFNDLVNLNKSVNIKNGKIISNFKLSLDTILVGDILEIELKDKKKNHKHYELSFSITDIDGKQHLVSIFHDISKRKEAQLELEHQKDDLEKLNDLMVGRELKMIELKKNILDLKSQKK